MCYLLFSEGFFFFFFKIYFIYIYLDSMSPNLFIPVLDLMGLGQADV